MIQGLKLVTSFLHLLFFNLNQNEFKTVFELSPSISKLILSILTTGVYVALLLLKTENSIAILLTAVLFPIPSIS